MTKESGDIGIYIHVPFCLSKCRYCDFYSVAGADDMLFDSYTDAVCRDLSAWHEEFGGRADTIYFGGGTPSLLGARRIAKIIDCAARIYRPIMIIIRWTMFPSVGHVRTSVRYR